MDTTLRSALEAAVLRLHAPLMGLLLEQGMGAGDFIRIAKAAFVAAACEIGRNKFSDRKPNVARIVLLTGLTRPAIVEILKASEGQASESLMGRQRVERILGGWWHDPKFLIRRTGKPAPLPFSGSDRSFTALCSRYSGNEAIAPTLRDELIRTGIARLRPDGLLQVLRRDYASVTLDAEGIAELGEQVSEHLETLIANLKNPHERRYVRRVVNLRLKKEWIRAVLPDMERRADVLADLFDRALNQPEATADPSTPADRVVKLGFGFHLVSEESTAKGAEVPNPGAAAGADSRRTPRRERRKK